jgi:hypothetical protein
MMFRSEILSDLLKTHIDMPLKCMKSFVQKMAN